MKFRMTCPKCGSTSFSIERDNRSYAPRGQTFEMIFSCRCGKQMFGDQIVKEHERQKKEWEAQDSADALPVPQDGPSSPGQARPEPARAGGRPGGLREDFSDDEEDDDLDDVDMDADEGEDEPDQDDLAHAVAAETQQEAEPPPAAPAADATEEAEEGDSDSCGWAGCTNPPRPNSKYCSRDCSNKNARLRYKKRKGTEKEAA